MLRWIPYAFVRIVFFFCAGILLAIHRSEWLTLTTASLLLALSGVLFLVLALTRKVIPINPGFLGLSAIFFAGYLNVLLHDDSRQVDHLRNTPLSMTYYRAIITKPAEEKERSWKAEATVLESKTAAGWQRVSGNIILYVAKPVVKPLTYGDEVLIRGTPQMVQPPANPGEFDYRQFLAYRNIYHQQYVRAKDIITVGHTPSNLVVGQALKIRVWALAVLAKYLPGDRERGLAAALILGVKEGLDDTVLDAYAASGAMHVLAVSGLHVGIIYWLILLLMRPFQKRTAAKWTVAAVSLVILWSYAAVTGLSPSVLRAVTMFSFLAIARPWNQRTNVFNILAASAFWLLLINPYALMSVGFQLSYLAVLGIVTLQPGLYRLWEPKYLFWDHIWRISSVAIAAQLATFSLGLFYFNQFPNLFLVSNLFVIPGAFLILLLGLCLLAVSFAAPLASAVGWLLHGLIYGLNTIIFALEKVPFSQLENVYINSFQCILLLACVAVVYLLVETRKFSYLVATAVICLTLGVSMWQHYVQHIARPSFTVYNVPGHTAIDLVHSGSAHFLADSALLKTADQAQYHILPNRLLRGVRQLVSIDSVYETFEGCGVVAWANETILHIYDEAHRIPAGTAFDYIVISNEAVGSLSEFAGRVKVKKIILDSSNSIGYSEQLRREAEPQTPVFSVRRSGAFTSTI